MGGSTSKLTALAVFLDYLLPAQRRAAADTQAGPAAKAGAQAKQQQGQQQPQGAEKQAAAPSKPAAATDAAAGAAEDKTAAEPPMPAAAARAAAIAAFPAPSRMAILRAAARLSTGTSVASLAGLEAALVASFKAPSFAALGLPGTSLLAAAASDPGLMAALHGCPEAAGHEAEVGADEGGRGCVSTPLGLGGAPPLRDVLALAAAALRALGPQVAGPALAQLGSEADSGTGGTGGAGGYSSAAGGGGGLPFGASGSGREVAAHHPHPPPLSLTGAGDGGQGPAGAASGTAACTATPGADALGLTLLAVASCLCRQYGVARVESLGYGGARRLLALCAADPALLQAQQGPASAIALAVTPTAPAPAAPTAVASGPSGGFEAAGPAGINRHALGGSAGAPDSTSVIQQRALAALASAPELSDLHFATQWQAAFEPSMGRLEDFLSWVQGTGAPASSSFEHPGVLLHQGGMHHTMGDADPQGQGQGQGRTAWGGAPSSGAAGVAALALAPRSALGVLELPHGRLVKVRAGVRVEDFVDAAVRGDARAAACCLLSLVAAAGGLELAPLSLLAAHAEECLQAMGGAGGRAAAGAGAFSRAAAVAAAAPGQAFPGAAASAAAGAAVPVGGGSTGAEQAGSGGGGSGSGSSVGRGGPRPRAVGFVLRCLAHLPLPLMAPLGSRLLLEPLAKVRHALLFLVVSWGGVWGAQ